MLANWVWARDGEGPRWWEVILWVVLVGLANVGLVRAIWSENTASGIFLAAISVAAWIWVLAAGRRRNRRAG